MRTRALTSRSGPERARAFIKATPSVPKAITNPRVYVYAHLRIDNAYKKNKKTPTVAGGGKHYSGDSGFSSLLQLNKMRLEPWLEPFAVVSRASDGIAGYTRCRICARAQGGEGSRATCEQW